MNYSFNFQDGTNNSSAGYIQYVDYSREYNPPPPPPPINYNRNSIYSAAPTLNNVDPRYSATYGNPYLRLPSNNKNQSANSGGGGTAQTNPNLNNSIGNNNKNAMYGQVGNNRSNPRNSNINSQYIMVPQTDTKFGVQGTHI